jgi:riboflavin kinase/FMN adenylyltransferase
VHLGHRQVVQPILNGTAALSELASSPQPEKMRMGNGESPGSPPLPRACATAVTFNPHPREFFTGQPKALLTPPEEKVAQLRAMGVKQLVLLPFDRELADLSPQQFVEEILVQKLRATRVSVGQDFRFGRGRAGEAADLQKLAAPYGIAVTVVPLLFCQGERISSSNIRQALLAGDLSKANRLLGRAYSLVGKVVLGQQMGRTLGFPTANLHLPAEKFLPAYGVYAVRVTGAGTGDTPAAGVMNIGCRPTVAGGPPTAEVHLLDWSADLYGKTLTVSLEHFLRHEQKFSSLDALKAQIHADCATAKSLLTAATNL